MMTKIKIFVAQNVLVKLWLTMRRPLFASLEGMLLGGIYMAGVMYLDGKINTVGMLTKIKISKAHGVLAGLRITSQAIEKFSITKLGNLTISSVWQIKKVFHRKIFITYVKDVKSSPFSFLSDVKCKCNFICSKRKPFPEISNQLLSFAVLIKSV